MRSDRIVGLLPVAYQRAATPGSVLSALLGVMDELHAPSEAVIAEADALAAAYRAPRALLPFLTRWVALDHLELAGTVPVGRLRDLVARGAYLAQWRGTATGLATLLETATGVPGFTVHEDRPFHFVVQVPAQAADRLELVRRIVAQEKPAATTCDVTVEGATK
jgi:phage tail-like protein